MKATNDTPRIRLRPAGEVDGDLLLLWANDPVSRAASFRSAHIPREEHLSWFHKKLSDPLVSIYIGIDNEHRAVGTIRFEREEDDAILSIIVNADHRGKGYGKELLKRGEDLIFEKTDIRIIHAYVKPENASSVNLFRSAGYEERERTTVHGVDAMHFVREKA